MLGLGSEPSAHSLSPLALQHKKEGEKEKTNSVNLMNLFHFENSGHPGFAACGEVVRTQCE
jgi:hypothetical protein